MPTPSSVVEATPSLSRRARLGLPYGKKHVFRRALMYLPWRMFVRPQVAFNRSVAEAITALEKSTRRLESRMSGLEQRINQVADMAAAAPEAPRHAAIAVREQLYETEGDLRRILGDIQMELERVRRATGDS